MICLCGYTATGKDTIQKELLKLGMKNVVSYTTRPPRSHEVNGVAYHFISQDKFLSLKAHGFFCETTSYDVANGETWCYGSAVKDMTDDKVIIVNPDGLKQLIKNNEVNPIVYLIMASEETIRERLKARGDNQEEYERRLIADKEDFKDIMQYVNMAIMNDHGITAKQIARIILDSYWSFGGINET